MSTYATTNTEYPFPIGSSADFDHLWPIEQHGTEEEKTNLRAQRKVAGEALRDALIDIGTLQYHINNNKLSVDNLESSNQQAVSELKQLEAELCRVIAARQELERQIEAKLDAESTIEAKETNADSESSLQQVVSERKQIEAELCRVISARTSLDNQIEEKLATLSLIKSQLEKVNADGGDLEAQLQAVLKKREEMLRPK